ncbi:MAG: metallophosphoesterase family protein [Cytophagales bacterium]
MTKKILLISDTHGFLPQQVYKYATDCDEIWHAGDIGNREVLSKLQNLKPTHCVFGNIDGIDIKIDSPENLIFSCEGVKILMTHIGGSPEKMSLRANKLILEHKPNVFICGHSHIVRVKSMPQYGNCLYINPGAAGNEGFHQIKTFMLLQFEDGKIIDIKVVELGSRGSK